MTTYIYYQPYGYGIKFQDKVFFEDGEVRDYQEDMKDITSVLKSIKVLNDYDRVLFTRFKDPSKNNDVSDVVVDVHPEQILNEIACKVTFKEDTYIVTLKDSCKCDCRRYNYRGCLHIQLAYHALAKLLQQLQDDYLYSSKAVDRSLFASSAILDKLSVVANESFERQMLFGQDAVIHLRRVNDSEYTKVFFKGLITLNHPYWPEEDIIRSLYPVVFCLLSDSDFYSTIITSGVYQEIDDDNSSIVVNNLKYFEKAVNTFDKALKQLNKGVYNSSSGDLAVLAYIEINKDLKLALRLIMSAGFYSYDRGLALLYGIAKNYELSDEDQESIKKFLVRYDSACSSYSDFTDFNKLVELLSLSKQAEMYLDCKFVRIPLEKYKSYSKEMQLQLCGKVELNDESVGYVKQNVLADADDKVKADYLLKNYIEVERLELPQKTRQKMLSIAKTIKNGRVLYNYLASSFSSLINTVSQSNKGVELKDEILPFFPVGFKFISDRNGYECEFIAYNPYCYEEVLCCSEERGKLEPDPLMAALKIDPNEFKAVCIEGREEAYEKEKMENEQKYALILFSKEHSKFVSDLKYLTSSLEDEEKKIVLSSDNKVRFEYYFYLEGDDAIYLTLKIGNSRFYVVRDFYDFIAAFKAGKKVKYGKDLIFSHDLENLADDDKKIMSLFLNSLVRSNPYDSHTRKFFKLQHQLAATLFEMLEGKQVYFDDVPVIVRLEDKSFRAQVDPTFHLKTTLGENQEILPLGNKSFVVTFSKPYGYLDRVDNTASEVGVLNFFDKYQDVDISPILDQIKNQVYSRNSHIIDIAPERKQDFKLSIVRINAYFDYDEKQIIVKEKFEKEGVEVTELEPLDKDKYKLYQDYLKMLGFDAEGRLTDEGQILSFFRMDFSHLRSLSTVYLSESISNKRLLSVSNQNFRITYKSGLMELFLEESEFSEEELATIIKALKKKKKYVILEGNKIVDLDNEEAKEFINTVEDFKLEGGDLHAKKQIPMTTAIKALAHQNNCHVDKYLKNMIEDLRTFKNADIALPKLEAKLRAYQREGFNWLSILSKYGLGGVLADDMGLGKTLQVIATIKADKTPKPSLIVCPKSLVFNWKSEFNKFDGQTEVVEIFGVEKDRSKVIEGIDYKKKVVYITSYDCLRSDEAKYTGQFCYLVLDEAQYIKNVFAQKTQSVKRLDAMHKFALTGTPIENSVVDLWSIFDFILPGYLEELKYFKGAEHDAIKRKIAPFVLRRTKEDVLSDLPAKYERILSTEMSKAQRKVYEAERAKAAKMLEAGGKAFDIFPYLTRLRQICIDPSMYLESFTELSSKLELLKTLIPEYLANGHRILIFSQFVKALNSMEAVLKTLGIPYYLLTGDTKANDRITMMNDFNEGLGVDVFLISLKAGGTGLNLTGADTVIHLDPWWNVAAEDQADDRTHRIGQKRNVEVIKLIAEESIEQRVIELQEIKKNIIDKVISNDDSSIVNATLEDIAFVLK